MYNMKIYLFFLPFFLLINSCCDEEKEYNIINFKNWEDIHQNYKFISHSSLYANRIEQGFFFQRIRNDKIYITHESNEHIPVDLIIGRLDNQFKVESNNMTKKIYINDWFSPVTIFDTTYHPQTVLNFSGWNIVDKRNDLIKLVANSRDNLFYYQLIIKKNHGIVALASRLYRNKENTELIDQYLLFENLEYLQYIEIDSLNEYANINLNEVFNKIEN